MKLITLLFLSVLATSCYCKYTIKAFEAQFTVKPSSGMYDIGGLKLDNLPEGGQMIGYGDFNNDKFTDIILLDDTLRKLTVYLYSHDTFDFTPLTTLVFDIEVAAVIPGDYNYDGKLDLLIVTQATVDTQPKTYLNYLFRIPKEPYFGDATTKFNLQKILDGKIQPFVIDIDGDRNLDVMFVENGKRKVLFVKENQLAIQDFGSFISDREGCKLGKDVSAYSFASPHSNAFLDFNGDCAADLFFTSLDANNKLTYEIWLRDPENTKLFCLVDVATIDSETSLVSFGDFNNDGRLDLIYSNQPTDLEKPMLINIIYNQFGTDKENPCSGSTEMKSPFNASGYNSQKTQDGINQIISLPEAEYSVGTRLHLPYNDNRPGKIRIGDMDVDGYADLIFVVNDPKKELRTNGSIVLLMNQKNTFTFNQTEMDSDDRGYYTLKADLNVTALADLPAQSVSFFDFDELGRLGLWIVVKDKPETKTSLIAGFNYVSTENFILKALGLNGYPAGSDDITPSLGGAYYGSSVECRVSDVDGKFKIAKGAQMPQSAYSPLDLPYSYIGLGRTNNYVEKFVLGITTANGTSDIQQHMWTPIIPNSQLIVNTLKNGEWTLDVYVNPASETLRIIVTTFIILVVLGAVIIYLHLKEKEEDEKAVDKMIHVFG